MSRHVRVLALARKEFTHLFRDPRALAMVLLLPVLELVLFAWAISFDVKNVPTIVCDLDQSAASRSYVDSYRASSLFNIVEQASNPEDIEASFKKGETVAGLVIPAGYSSELDAGGRPAVAVWLNGAQTNTAKVAQAYAEALNQSNSRSITLSWVDKQGAASAQAAGILEPRLRTWYNPDRVSSIFLVPGIIVVIVMIVAVQQTAVSLVKEREQHTEEQLLLSPLTDAELMVGKILPWAVFTLADVVVIVGLSVTAFEVPLRGSILALGLGFVLFTIASLSIGLLVSSLAPSMETGNMLAQLIAFLPAFMLSGFAFPLDAIPGVLQGISYLFPGRYMLTLSRGVFLKGAGFAEVWLQLAALAGYAVVLIILATFLYHRRQRR